MTPAARPKADEAATGGSGGDAAPALRARHLVYLESGEIKQGAFRFVLTRRWHLDGKRLLFVMLNPSTASDVKDDPTLSRCAFFANRLGYGALEVVNLFAFRSPSPAALDDADDKGDGALNDEMIRVACERADAVVAAWGATRLRSVSVPLRALRVRAIVRRAGRALYCLGRTRNGSPKHPLARGRERIPDDAALLEFGE